jgi:competence protein ComEC
LSYKALEIGMAVLNWLNQLLMATWQHGNMATLTLVLAMLGVLWMLLPLGFPLRWLALIGFLPMLLMVLISPVLGDKKVTVLDVGQCLRVVVQTAKQNLVYDVGPNFNEKSDTGSCIVITFYMAKIIKM